MYVYKSAMDKIYKIWKSIDTVRENPIPTIIGENASTQIALLSGESLFVQNMFEMSVELLYRYL